MQDSLNQAVSSIQSAADLLERASNEADVDEICREIGDFAQKAGQLAGHDPGRLHGSKTQAAELRRDLHRLRSRVEETETRFAEQYRRQLGADKDKFEQLTPDRQQVDNPSAFDSLQMFRSLRNLHDLLDQVNSLLLDVDFLHSGLAASDRTETGGVEPDGGQDPVRPTLSP